jgi:hypothetical protein
MLEKARHMTVAEEQKERIFQLSSLLSYDRNRKKEKNLSGSTGFYQSCRVQPRRHFFLSYQIGLTSDVVGF